MQKSFLCSHHLNMPHTPSASPIHSSFHSAVPFVCVFPSAIFLLCAHYGPYVRAWGPVYVHTRRQRRVEGLPVSFAHLTVKKRSTRRERNQPTERFQASWGKRVHTETQRSSLRNKNSYMYVGSRCNDVLYRRSW